MTFIVIVIIVFLIFVGKAMHSNAVRNRREGTGDRTVSQNILIGSAGCFAIPAVLMIAIMSVYGIVYCFLALKLMFDIGHPITIFFGICIIIGSIGILYTAIRG